MADPAEEIDAAREGVGTHATDDAAARDAEPAAARDAESASIIDAASAAPPSILDAVAASSSDAASASSSDAASDGAAEEEAASTLADRGRAPDDATAPTMAPSSTLIRDAKIGAVDPNAAEAWIGRTIDGRYKILEVLGEGGMGSVFVAENLNFRKHYALKVIRREFAGDPEIAARFSREATATAKLEHPHVASAVDYGHLPDGSAFLVIQLVRGRSLSNLLNEQALAWPQACDIVAQIADALAAAHGAGIVHRDLKPDNVLLERRDDGRYHAKVLDFGIARVAEEGGGHGPSTGVVTRMGVVMGTPGYMSPEQAIGERVDHRTDLYALGVILWECITGRPLWIAESLTELVSRQLSEAPPPIVTITGMAVPEVLEKMIGQLLARRPDGRPGAAATIRDALRKLATGGDGSEVAASTTGFSFGRRTEVAPMTVHSTLITTTSPWMRARAHARRMVRDPQQRVLVIAVAVGLVLFLGFWALFSGDDPAPEEPPSAAPSESVDEDGEAASDDAKGPKKKDPKRDSKKKDATQDGKDDDPASAAGAAAKNLVADAAAAIQSSSEVQALIDTLLNEDSASKRKSAASDLKARAAESAERVPPFARLIADLELAKGCSAKKKVIVALEAEKDPRALPVLRRIAESPKQGCGFLGMRDCLECARKPLASAIKALSADASP
ncbi:MAG: serine/threonine-protein kinase [Nannocystaceae bacterium]